MRWTTLGGYPVKQYNSPNRGGAMSGHRGVVCHVAEGTYAGTIAWQMNPDQEYADGTNVNTCSTWIIGKNAGEIAQMVDTDEIAWCQRSGSRDWLSIEFAGYHTQALTAWQIEAAALVLAAVHEHYGVPLQVAPDPSVRGLGHHSMDREALGEEWGHEDCPGPKIIAQKPQIVARAIEIKNGDDGMAPIDEQALIWRVEAIFYGRDEVNGGPHKGTPNGKVGTWDKIAEVVLAKLGTAPGDGVTTPSHEQIVAAAKEALSGAQLSGTVSGSVSGTIRPAS